MIDYLDLKKITAMHHDEIQSAVAHVIDSGWYLRGEATMRFERDYAAYIGTDHCVACANGLDALTLIFRAYKQMGLLHEGDEVIVPANTYIASILSITENGLKPILVEPDIETLQIDDTRIEEVITPRTRAVMVVHLYGRNALTPRIQALCEQHHLKIIEDNAQAQGCSTPAFKAQSAGSHSASLDPQTRRLTGAWGHAAAHSFYPGKNLGALGDAGAVTTCDEQLASVIRSMANYGSNKKYVFPYQGKNSRMDEIQAAVLSVKLKYLDAENARRKAIARYYYRHVNNPLIVLPGKRQWQTALSADHTESGCDEHCVYHIFPVLCNRRDELQQYLQEKGVATMIHYPIPPHKQECYKAWNALNLPITEHIHQCELSIPCNPAMTDDDAAFVCEQLNGFVSSRQP